MNLSAPSSLKRRLQIVTDSVCFGRRRQRARSWGKPIGEIDQKAPQAEDLAGKRTRCFSCWHPLCGQKASSSSRPCSSSRPGAPRADPR